MSEWIPEAAWATIVRNVPIVSVDLVVECPEGIVLGRRTNKPARGEWFVPGGRLHKGERLTEAVHRLAAEEVGVEVTIRDRLGAFEHRYETSEVGTEKHYVAHGFHVWTDQTTFADDDQHDTLRAFAEPPDDLHPYAQDYLACVDRV